MVNNQNTTEDSSLAVRAAWLHYAGGMTQAAVAKKLGLTSVKVNRLISRANEKGYIKVSIEGDIAECVALEAKLTEEYGLDYCEVTPDLGEKGLPLRSLAPAVAQFLIREITNGQNEIIGVGHGRSLAAGVVNIPQMTSVDVKFVSLLGGLTRNFAANPHDVMHRLAVRTSAQAYVMPVPFFANSVQDRDIILSQRGVAEVMAMAETAPLKVIGIGSVEPQAQLVSSHMMEGDEIENIRKQGGCGEILGHFFDKDGQLLETDLSKRTLSIGVDALKNGKIVAVAGGEEKIQPIKSILRSGYLGGLITDERTAQALITS